MTYLLIFGEIFETYPMDKKGILKILKDHKKYYSYKIFFSGKSKIDGLEEYIPQQLQFFGLFTNRIHTRETLEEAIESKQKIIYSFFLNYNHEKDIPDFEVEKGKFEDDVNYDKDYLINKYKR